MFNTISNMHMPCSSHEVTISFENVSAYIALISIIKHSHQRSIHLRNIVTLYGVFSNAKLILGIKSKSIFIVYY